MQYIFDFDRAVFDTDRLKELLIGQGKEHLLGQAMSLNEIHLPDLIFEDVHRFFAAHDCENVYVVTSCLGTTGHWSIEYQREKVRRSGIAQFVQEVFVVEMSKIEAIRSLSLPYDSVFVDDMVEHLREVKQALPHFRCVCIQRKKQDIESSDFHVISSLDELDAILKLL